MKITAMTASLLMAGAVAYGQSRLTRAERNLTVCFEDQTAGWSTVGRARMLAYKMFGDIGVNIDWRAGFTNCPANAILIGLRGSTPASLCRGALAYALPYEGTHIEIFYDRVSRHGAPALVSIVLAHVLVHEITHILQGVPRHSQEGIMKAHWGREDIFQMVRKPLKFTQDDIDLIYRGLASRARGPILALNREAAVADQ